MVLLSRVYSDIERDVNNEHVGIICRYGRDELMTIMPVIGDSWACVIMVINNTQALISST